MPSVPDQCALLLAVRRRRAGASSGRYYLLIRGRQGRRVRRAGMDRG